MAQIKQKELTGIIQNLCKAALKGELTLGTFYDSLQEKDSINPFFKQIYEDIEDGVQHLPGAWLTGKTLSKEWYKSAMYFAIYLDFVLLDYDKNSDELMRCRKFILEEKNLSEEIIRNRVKEYFKL